MNIKQLLIPTALASSFALGIYTSQGTKQLLTSAYNAFEQTVEQYTSLDLPHLPTPQPSYSPTSQPSSSSTAQQHHSSTPPGLPDPQLQQKMLQLEQQNAALKQKLYTQTPTLPTAQPQQPSQHNYTPRARELSAHDLAQPFLMAFADKTQHFLGKHLDEEQQALQLYNQLANNLDLLNPTQRHNLAQQLEENDTRWLTSQQQTDRLYEKTKQSLGKLPDEKRASLDQLLHLSNPELTTPCLTFNPFPYLQNLLTILTYTTATPPTSLAYHSQNQPFQNSDTIPQLFPKASALSLPQPISLTIPPDYEQIITQQITTQLDQQLGPKLQQSFQQIYDKLTRNFNRKITTQIKHQVDTKLEQTGNCKIDKLELSVNAQVCPQPLQQPLSLPEQHSPAAASADVTQTSK